MHHPRITAPTGTTAATGGNTVDIAKLAADAKKLAPGAPAANARQASPPLRSALGGSVLNPDLVKAFVTAYLPEAQKIVDTAYAKYIKLKPELKIKFLTPEELKVAANGSNYDGVFAFVDSTSPTTINVAWKSPVFKNFKLDASDAKALFLHEVLHTRSQPFTIKMADAYAPANGRPASFPDGSLVMGITEGITELLTMESLKINSTPSGYTRETKWAVKLVQMVGFDTVRRAYFRADPMSMEKVGKAISELMAADQSAPASRAPRSPSSTPSARLPSAGTGRNA